jgi:hypothetical protein
MKCLFPYVSTVVQGLPDSAPPFTAADLKKTEEAVLKFQRKVIVGLKDLLLKEIYLYKTDSVDDFYGMS